VVAAGLAEHLLAVLVGGHAQASQVCRDVVHVERASPVRRVVDEVVPVLGALVPASPRRIPYLQSGYDRGLGIVRAGQLTRYGEPDLAGVVAVEQWFGYLGTQVAQIDGQPAEVRGDLL
jgi:hypothetical protein